MRYLTLTQTLVYYDGPQLVQGRDGRGTSYLAVGVPSHVDGQSLFLAVAVSDRKLEDYFSEAVDLRNVFRHPKKDRYFTFVLDESIGGRFLLTEKPTIDDDWLPSAGFFASQHTDSTDDEDAPETRVIDIPIDGRWDMQDLAQFPNKFTDAYAFLFAVAHDPNGSTADRLKPPFAELFQRYPWRGGFSSVSFYDDLYRSIPRNQRLKIREIRYASPGVIRIETSATLAGQIRAMVLRINEDWRPIKQAYRELHDGLSERNFLGRSRYEIQPSASDKAFARGACRNLSAAIDFSRIERVHELCDRDWIATAKILLSFYRRIEELADFYDSGKATFAT